MKIIVPISIVPDIYYPVENHISHYGINVPDEYLDINPLDKQTLSRAMALGEDIEAIHIGDTPREKALRYLIAMGVKNLTHIKAPALDAYTTAIHIASFLTGKDYDIIMCSNSSWDYASGQTPEYLSEILGIPIINDVSHIEKNNDGKICITCSHDDCIEHIDEITTPVILSCDKSIFPAECVHIPSMRDMMMAMRTPIETTISPENPSPLSTYTSIRAATPRPVVQMLQVEDISFIAHIICDNGTSPSSANDSTVSLYSGRVEADLISKGTPSPIKYPHNGIKETLPVHNDIKEASIIISGGMGCDAHTWEMIDKIAEKINACVGCTRPVFHAGIRPYYQHIGQTGTRVSPRVYIAVGISGALQHIGGMVRSEKVIAINTDPHAPIFSYSDYGIVAPAAATLEKLYDYLTKQNSDL